MVPDKGLSMESRLMINSSDSHNNPTTMKKRTLSLAVGSLIMASPSFAEKSAEQINQSFLKTSQKYEDMAVKAARDGNAADAAIYQKLAAIKRDAAAVQGNYDWSEYHKLKAQLSKSQGGQWKKAHKKDAKLHKEKPHKKGGYSAEGAAEKYEKLAAEASQAGAAEKASIYRRMAAIKREAAASGGKYDWTEYHALEAELSKL